MLHSRTINSKIKRIHERYLRLIYSDKDSSCKKLLEKDAPVSMHHKNIQAFATEMFKVKYDLCPEIACNIFIEGRNCRL